MQLDEPGRGARHHDAPPDDHHDQRAPNDHDDH
jgi:hypothetical protein